MVILKNCGQKIPQFSVIRAGHPIFCQSSILTVSFYNILDVIAVENLKYYKN